MSLIRRPVRRARRRVFAAAVLAGVTLLGATACTGVDSSSQAGGKATAHATAGADGAIPSDLASGLPSGLLDGLPSNWDDLKNWSFDDWDKWAQQHVFNNPVIQNLWNPDKMKKAKPKDQTPPSSDAGGDSSGTDPEPAPIKATALPHPYTRYAAVGKIFFDEPEGTAVCSGTVVSDPAHPGKSNLVWTAGHCVHGGKGSTWYKHIIFVPAYNSSGAGSGGRQSLDTALAPLGQWWAKEAVTSPQWAAEGGKYGDKASQYDFAILRVQNPDGDGRSLEETVGSSVPVWFNAPRSSLTSVSAWGYPAAPPFDGQELYRCVSPVPPVRLSYDTSRPAMLTIGCTMTGGASGGGWFATMPDGRTALVSNNSIGTVDHTTLSGPYLETVAKQAFGYLSRKS